MSPHIDSFLLNPFPINEQLSPDVIDEKVKDNALLRILMSPQDTFDSYDSPFPMIEFDK